MEGRWRGTMWNKVMVTEQMEWKGGWGGIDGTVIVRQGGARLDKGTGVEGRWRAGEMDAGR